MKLALGHEWTTSGHRTWPAILYLPFLACHCLAMSRLFVLNSVLILYNPDP